MSHIKSVSFTLDAHTFHGGVPPYLRTITDPTSIDLRCVLTHVATWTRCPLLPKGAHISWACSRYLHLFRPGRSLRLIPEWAEADPHQKAVLSDDIGVGATTYLLTEKAGFRDFSFTSYVQRHGRPIAPVAYPSNRRSADYIGTRSHGHHIALECKGTQGSRRALAGFLNTGTRQKQATRRQFRSKLRYGMVGGIFAPHSHSSQNALIRLRDPPLPADPQAAEEVPEDELDFRVFCGSLSSQLAAAGAEHAAIHVATRTDQPLDELARNEIERASEPRIVFCLSKAIPDLPAEKDVTITASIEDDMRNALLSRTPLSNAFKLGSRAWEHTSTESHARVATSQHINITVLAVSPTIDDAC